jgi:C4-dicarboxylate-specific signal transduction histidine kinase
MIKAFATTFILVVIQHICFSQFGGSDELRDSLIHELSIAKDDTSRVNIMAEGIANAYLLKNSDSTIRYGNLALTLARDIRFFRGEASALNALGTGYQIKGDFPKAFECLYKGLRIAESHNYVFEKAVCFEWIGSAYWFLADYLKSTDFYRRSESLFQTIVKKPGVTDWIRFNILSLGQAYLDWGHLDSAKYYLVQFYNITLNDKAWHPEAEYELGDCLFQKGNRDTAFNLLHESIAGAVEVTDYYAQTEGCAAISRFFATIQQHDSAIFYAKQGLAAASEYAYDLGIFKNIKLLANEYEYVNIAEALHYHKVYDSLNESLYGAKKVQDLQKTLAEDQQRQQQAQEQQIERESRLKQYGFTAGLAIMLLIAFILYRNNQQKKKANVLLQHQKEKVESTLQELKSTQAQLIQQEKMASLGELTAGIAHEIQNPLNFVNNFSEINSELIDELREQVDKGSFGDIKPIADNIRENEQKINIYGKRADSIVKGMLEHSRKSTGTREPTDVNALCDKYLRLSYQGFRAKEDAFNASIESSFDNTIPKLNIVPQEIGRVLLNIYNNAFFAVDEKKKSGKSDYEPLVTVSTKQRGNNVDISIADNGSGIPVDVISKIFQPFFTTKPTGKGTGLGLSISYDIVRAHGGSIKATNRDHGGAEFIISLPVN